MVRALFVGRFQPFHMGHLKALQHILKENDEVVIIVGSSQISHEKRNPFTTGERIEMIRRALREAGVEPDRYIIIPVPDVEAHSTWVSQVESYTPRFDVVYTNEPLTARLFKEAGYEVRPIPFFDREVYSATEIRRRILAGEEWSSLVPRSVYEFIKEIGGDERIRDLNKTDKVVRGGGQGLRGAQD